MKEGEESLGWMMLMWAVTVVGGKTNQPKSWLHQEEPAAMNNKVITTQALQMLTAGGETVQLERYSHGAV